MARTYRTLSLSLPPEVADRLARAGEADGKTAARVAAEIVIRAVDREAGGGRPLALRAILSFDLEVSASFAPPSLARESILAIASAAGRIIAGGDLRAVGSARLSLAPLTGAVESAESRTRSGQPSLDQGMMLANPGTTLGSPEVGVVEEVEEGEDPRNGKSHR